MNFLANMGISPVTVDYLRDLGHDATHLHEEALDRMTDAEILGKARQEDKIVLTSDLDFGDLLAASGDELPSVVIFRLKNMQPANVNAHLARMLEQNAGELTEGVVISVAEDYFRVRRLPISSDD